MADGAKLLAHCGAQIVTREDLKQYVTPEATETFKPVGHSQLVETLTQVMQDRGLFITHEQFAVQNHKLFGTFDLEWQRMEDYGAAVGFRHANDKSMPITIAVGARVFVCDNMSMLGELITVRKHTSKLDLGEEMDRAMYKYIQGFRRLQDDIQVWKESPVEERRGKLLIYDVFQQKILPLKLFHPTVASWEAVTRENSTAWSLNNACTQHIKTLAPAPAFRCTARLAKFFSTKF
jgi:hypothetical protein